MEYKEGQIVKKSLTSKQMWVLRELEGTLMAVPITNSYFTDTEPIELTDDMIILPEVRGTDLKDEDTSKD